VSAPRITPEKQPIVNQNAGRQTDNSASNPDYKGK